MATIKQRIPNWADIPAKTSEFNSLEELLKIDFVEHFKGLNNFYRYSISKEVYQFHKSSFLMCELDEGKKWWVVGFLDDADELVLKLPKWEPINEQESKMT